MPLSLKGQPNREVMERGVDDASGVTIVADDTRRQTRRVCGRLGASDVPRSHPERLGMPSERAPEMRRKSAPQRGGTIASSAAHSSSVLLGVVRKPAHG
ncbi:hypothetical protein MTO96_010575 [Rhipicephalus appendiculatus]